jgi:hypothetical protein
MQISGIRSRDGKFCCEYIGGGRTRSSSLGVSDFVPSRLQLNSISVPSETLRSLNADFLSSGEQDM